MHARPGWWSIYRMRCAASDAKKLTKKYVYIYVSEIIKIFSIFMFCFSISRERKQYIKKLCANNNTWYMCYYYFLRDIFPFFFRSTVIDSPSSLRNYGKQRKMKICSLKESNQKSIIWTEIQFLLTQCASKPSLHRKKIHQLYWASLAE